jgi:hypothetical protein
LVFEKNYFRDDFFVLETTLSSSLLFSYKPRFAQAFRRAKKLVILLKTSTIKKSDFFVDRAVVA